MTRLPIDSRPPHIRDRDREVEDVAIRKEINDRLSVLNYIDALRKDEGNSVTILCDNPDFGGPASAVEVCGDWTDWKDRRFAGDTLLSALERAHVAMCAARRG